MTNTIPNTPTLREVLDRGDDPADLLGGYEYLADIVVMGAIVEPDDVEPRATDVLDTLARIDEMKANGVRIINDPAGFFDLALRTRWEVELMRDRELLGRLLTEYAHGADLTDRVADYYKHISLRVEVVGEEGLEECSTCARELAIGERALIKSEICVCFRCLRTALAGVDLEEPS